MTHGKDKRNFLVVDAEEFIALITQHIPGKSNQLVRYYGFYSNRARGERRKEADQKTNLDSTATPEEIEVIDVSPDKTLTYEPFDDGWPEYEEPFITVD